MSLTDCEILDAEAWLRATDALVTDILLPDPATLPHRRIAWRYRPFVASVEDVTVLPADWLLLSADRKLLLQWLHQSLPEAPGRSAYVRAVTGTRATLELPGEPEVVEEPCVMVGSRPMHYHWLVDYLPRLYALEQFSQLRELRLLVRDDFSPQQAESLALLGVDPTRILRLAADRVYRFRTLWFASLLADAWYLHPAALAWLRRTYAGGEPTARPGRRLFLSRRDASSRRLLNEDEVSARLEALGYERIKCARLGFAEQVALFSGAESVVGVSGSALANVLFAPVSTRVVELHNVPVQAAFFERMCQQIGQPYVRVVGQPRPVEGLRPHDLDFTVPPDAVLAAVRALEQEPAP